ncbi:hypothetical protein CANDROIZ_460011 [Candidatus Roizmanbacteria bacterium]|nr:hypothetical protein CANDROIZ_460011 [Candidatus Roizmanbacteria bacterium]
MSEQFRAIVKDKSIIQSLVKLVLTYGTDKLIPLETKVTKCLLTKNQVVNVFTNNNVTTIVSPDCGDCQFAAKNEAQPPKICHVYRDNRSTFKV